MEPRRRGLLVAAYASGPGTTTIPSGSGQPPCPRCEESGTTKQAKCKDDDGDAAAIALLLPAVAATVLTDEASTFGWSIESNVRIEDPSGSVRLGD